MAIIDYFKRSPPKTMAGIPGSVVMSHAGQEGIFIPRGDGVWNSLLNVVNGGGGYPSLLFGGHVMTRGVAAGYATLFRCATLISGVAADMITTSIYVVDADGDAVDDRRTRRVVRLLQEAPSGRHDAYSFVENSFADLCLDGNAVIYIDRGGDMPLSLRLMNSWSATGALHHGTIVYTATELSGGAEELMDARDVIHAAWPMISGRGGVGGREFFADAPVRVMSKAIEIGLNTDSYLNDYFNLATGGVKSRVSVAYPRDDVDPVSRAAVVQSIQQHTNTRAPLITFGGAIVTSLNDGPQNADAVKLREFQVRELGRVLGVPAPLLGENVSQYGSGIESLGRMFYQYGLKQQLGRVLSQMSWRLLPPGQKFAVDELTLLRGDSMAMAKLIPALLGSAQQPSLLTPSEVRQRVVGVPGEAPPWQPSAAIAPAPTPEPDDIEPPAPSR